MQLGQMAIEPVLLVISIMASVVTQAVLVTLPTAALAIEAGPLGGNVSALRVCRTGSESNIRSVSLWESGHVFAAVQVAPGLRIRPRKLAITWGDSEAHDD